jgi:hypothetical protein
MYVLISHDQINESVAALKGVTMPEAHAVQGETLLTAAQRVAMIYRPLIPLLMVLASTPFFPSAFRAGFTLLAQALDLLANAVASAPSAPSTVTASAAATDTTIPDPFTDPSFKAGKDL